MEQADSELDAQLKQWWGTLTKQQMRAGRSIAQTSARVVDEPWLRPSLLNVVPGGQEVWPDDVRDDRMPQAVADFIKGQPDRTSWRGHGSLTDAEEAAARHFGHANFHLVEWGGIEGVDTSWTFEEGEA